MFGQFITFEGIDGCGKSTQISLLEQKLKKNNIPYLLTREPGGSILGQDIRKKLLDPDYSDPPMARAEMLLFLADRAQHVEKIILPSLKKGICVISDRYTDSTLVYQGYARGIDINDLKELNRIATDALLPNRTIVFDLSAEAGALRVENATEEFKKADRLESENEQFRKKIRQGYIELAKDEPNRIQIINADNTPEQIHKEVCQCLGTLPNLEKLHV